MKWKTDEKKLLKILNVITISIIILNLFFGVLGAITGQDFFFVCESIWVVAGFLLLIFHAYPTLGAKLCWAMVIAMCIVSLFFESMGCNFGLFFTKYVYTDYIPGPKLFGFNVYSMIAYGIGAYIIWGTVRSAVGQYGAKLTKSDVVFMPVLSSLILVTVDFATDPFLSTIHQTHLWEKPGVFYGIPWQNYMGWYLMAYVLYLIVALMIYYAGNKNKLPEQPAITKKKAFWIYPPLLYASLWIQMPFYALSSGANDRMVTVASNGQTYMTSQIYWGVMIVMTGAMVTPAVMAIARVLKDESLKN